MLLLVAALGAGTACAVELPPADTLEMQTGVQPRLVTVVEPHESRGKHPVLVEYRGFPMSALLDRWFGAAWKAEDAELVFHAADGYRSAIAGSRLQGHQAYLAFSRGDGRVFAVDNPAQHQTGVPLGPYYLIWDNRGSPELLAQGTFGWPYQVIRIELRSSADDRALIPPGATDELKAGLVATRDHCLTCHRVRGVGGAKHPVALERLVCSWADDPLKAFIADPSQSRPGTAMPSLDVPGGPDVRRQTVGRIVAYLRAVAAADSVCR